MTYFNQDVSGTVFSSKLRSYWRCLVLNRTLGKRNIIFCVVKNIMVQVRAIFKRSRKEERYKTSITRECASLCSILYWFFCLTKWQLPHVYKLHKNQYRLSCTALKNVWPNSEFKYRKPFLVPMIPHYFTLRDSFSLYDVTKILWVPFNLDDHQES